MRQGLWTLIALGLLGAVVGCKTHGVCDCDVHPIGGSNYGPPAIAAHPDNPMPPHASMPAPK
jgi:hypothetical protein